MEMSLQRELDVEIVTLGEGLVATFRLPASASARDVREEVQQKLGIPSLEQRLAVGTEVFDGVQRLQDVVPDESSSVQLTLVHIEGIRSAALSGTRAGALLLWDLKDGKLVHRIRESGAAVTCAAMNWVAQLALCGDHLGALQLWDLDLDKGKLLREMRAPAGVLCLSSDWMLMRAISGYEDGNLRMWDLEHGEVIFELRGHAGAVQCVAWDVAANVAISGSQEGSLKLWDLTSGRTMHDLVGHLAPVHCVEADFSRQFAVSGSIATVRLWWNISSTYHYYKDLSGHTGQVLSVVADFRRRIIVTGSSDGRLQFWSLAGRRLLNIPDGAVPVTCVAALWPSDEFVAGSADGLVRVWSHTGKQRITLDQEVEASGTPNDAVLCVSCDGVDAVEGRPRLCSPVGALLSLPDMSPGDSRKVFPVTVQPSGNVSGLRSVRPTIADLQQHLAVHKITYMERLRFQLPGWSTMMNPDDKLPLPPREVLVNGPDSVLQMLSIALSRNSDCEDGKGLIIASFELEKVDDEETTGDWIHGFWK